VADYKLSRAAERDLRDLLTYGIERFGAEQARRYADGLSARLDRIALAPLQFPEVDDIRPGYRRSVYGSHVIYFKSTSDCALIVRILGRQSFDPASWD